MNSLKLVQFDFSCGLLDAYKRSRGLLGAYKRLCGLLYIKRFITYKTTKITVYNKTIFKLDFI